MRISLCLLVVALFLGGCKKKLTEFYIDYTSELIVQSSVQQLVPISFNTPEIESNSEFEFESNNTRKDHVKSIKLKELRLTITSPSNETFSFLNSVEIFISSPNLSEKKVAFRSDIDANVGVVLACNIEDQELQDFVKEDRFTLRVKAITDETIPQDVHIDIYTNFKVNAKLIK